jgi:hypothetical protein
MRLEWIARSFWLLSYLISDATGYYDIDHASIFPWFCRDKAEQESGDE